MKPFIVFEGINGAGKTTLSKVLAKELQAFYIATPHRLLIQIREKIDEQSSLSAHFFYYMLGNILVSDEIKIIRKSRIVVCDRYIHSTIARHTILGLDIGFDIDSFNLEIPDISFFIFASDDIERQERIRQRNKKTKWDELDENEELRLKYINYFRQKGDFVFIDTSHESVEESLKKIKIELCQRKIV